MGGLSDLQFFSPYKIYKMRQHLQYNIYRMIFNRRYNINTKNAMCCISGIMLLGKIFGVATSHGVINGKETKEYYY